MSLKECLKKFFIVHKCGGCRKILEYEDFEEALCPECSLRFRVAKTESCGACQKSAVNCTCMSPLLKKSGALSLRKLYFYHTDREYDFRGRLVYFLKRFPVKRVALFVAEELWTVIREELMVLDATSDNTVIVNLPRGRGSKRVNGFDQTAFVSGYLSNISGIPHVEAIKRRLGGKEQKQLDRKGRMGNVRGLFYLKDVEAVKDKYVILYDDVVTTGASMTACVELLKKAGAKGVFCLCMAQVAKNSIK